MNAFIRHGLSIALAFGVIAGAGFSPVVAAETTRSTRDYLPQDELEQLLAPVALYPDALLTQVLIAATYPLDVVQAARFIAQNPGLRGEALVRAAESKPWDESVIALLQTPSVIVMMNDKLDWTQDLGDAFLDQRDEVMDTVQTLRAQARSAGALSSNEQQSVVVRDRVIVIEPARPEYIYVPYYDPYVVYGNWRWSRRPWFWEPPPVYRPSGWGSIGVGIAWGIGIGVSHERWYSHRPDWREHSITVNNHFYGNRPPRPGVVITPPGVWQHRPDRRDNDWRPRRDAPRDERPDWNRPSFDTNRDRPRVEVRPDVRPDMRPDSRPATRPQDSFFGRPNNQPEPHRPQTRPERDDRVFPPRPMPEIRQQQNDSRRSLPEARQPDQNQPRPNFDRGPEQRREHDKPMRDERGRDRDRMR